MRRFPRFAALVPLAIGLVAFGREPETKDDPAGPVSLIVDLPGTADVRARRDLTYGANDESPQPFSIYLPPENLGATPPYPTVLIATAATKSDPASIRAQLESEAWARLIAASGMAAITYTIRPENHEAPLLDAWSLMLHLRTNSKDLGIAMDRLGVVGFGSHYRVAKEIMLDADFANEIRCGVIMCPTDPEPEPVSYRVFGMGAVRDDLPLYCATSGVINEEAGPVLILTSALLLKKTPEFRWVHIGQTPRFDLHDNSPIAQAALLEALQFLKRHTSAEPVTAPVEQPK